MLFSIDPKYERNMMFIYFHTVYLFSSHSSEFLGQGRGRFRMVMGEVRPRDETWSTRVGGFLSL